MSSEQRRAWIEWQQPTLSITRQCALVGVPRSTVYYEPVAVSAADLELMRRLDEQYTRTPFYGSRQMTAWLRTQGQVVNRKRVTRLLGVLGLEALVPRRRLSTPALGHRIYPYLLRGVSIDRQRLTVARLTQPGPGSSIRRCPNPPGSLETSDGTRIRRRSHCPRCRRPASSAARARTDRGQGSSDRGRVCPTSRPREMLKSSNR